MFTIPEILEIVAYGLVLPGAAVCLALAIACAYAVCNSLRALFEAIAIVIALYVFYYVRELGPLRPKEDWHWLLPSALLGGILSRVSHRSTKIRSILFWFFIAAVASLVLVPTWGDAEKYHLTWSVVLALVIAFAGMCITLCQRIHPLVLPFYAAATMVFLEQSGNGNYMFMLLPAFAAGVAISIIGWWWKDEELGRGLATVLACFLPGLLLEQRSYAGVRPPWTSSAVMAIAPWVSLVLADLLPRRPWRIAIVIASCLVPAAVALGLAWTAP